MAIIKDVFASVFIVVTMPATIYHSVQAARKSKIEGASEPHVKSANWYLNGGWLGKLTICNASSVVYLTTVNRLPVVRRRRRECRERRELGQLELEVMCSYPDLISDTLEVHTPPCVMRSPRLMPQTLEC